jgi:ribonuclease R
MEKEIYTGKFIANAKGFGFVEVEDLETDIFIGEMDVKGAMHGDTVEVRIRTYRGGKRPEGVIVKVLERGVTEVVGTFQRRKNFGFVVCDNQKILQDIFIPLEAMNGAVDGQKVVAELTAYAEKGKKPEGKIKEVLGFLEIPGTDILCIAKEYQLPLGFSEKQLNQADRIAKPVSEADMFGRMDLRDTVMVTIDGEDAKDLDDAVSMEKVGELYRLGVHIADVANYVQESSALDKEALKRGTSVYLVDRVIPMLPKALSNGICSLNAGEDRLALSCIMDVDEKGNVVNHTIAETVIHVNERMTYTSVKKILEDKDEAEREKYKELVPMFEMMAYVANILREKRSRRGSIDFDFPETKVKLNALGQAVDILPYDRNTATKLIEDFMLLANETVAEHFFWQELPFVYRTHEKPDPEKMTKLGIFIRNFGYYFKAGNGEVHPKELQKLLEKISGTKEEALLSRLTLRSMQRAAYTTECSGHFGLAAQYYCHFTSPIRRYPDLQIHRIIKDSLRGRLNERKLSHYGKILPEVALHSSKMERRADEAERETVKLKKAEYMKEHLGEIYEGVISGVTNYGIYVELDNTVEGIVHVNSMKNDYYYFDEIHYELVGQDSGVKYKLGERVLIQVKRVDMASKTIDFRLIDREDDDHGESSKGECEADCE